MEILKKYTVSFILGAVFCLFIVKSCEPETSTVEVVIPAQKGELPTVNPVEVDSDSIVYVDRWLVKDSIVPVYLKNPINDSLAQAYKSASSEIERYKIYIRSIQIRKYSQTFDDEFINLTVSGDVQGDIIGMGVDYTLKERTARARVPETVFRWTLGGQTRSDLGLKNPSFDITSGFQNRKGNILRVGYSRFKGDDYFLLGYEFSVFDLKR